jgi:ureidoglycolate hydrolase
MTRALKQARHPLGTALARPYEHPRYLVVVTEATWGRCPVWSSLRLRSPSKMSR